MKWDGGEFFTSGSLLWWSNLFFGLAAGRENASLRGDETAE